MRLVLEEIKVGLDGLCVRGEEKKIKLIDYEFSCGWP